MRTIARRLALGLGGLIALGAASDAGAWDRYGDTYGYRGAGYGAYYGGGYGFAGEAVGGDYIGAPFTRFPRPNEIVPPAWGYGTYGVSTATGIRQAPTAAPTLTVINASPPAPRRTGPRILSRGAQGSWSDVGAPGSDPTMPRVVTVTVPRR